MRPLEVVAHAFTRFTHSTATTPADTREIVVSALPTSSVDTLNACHVLPAIAANVEEREVPPTVGIFVLSISVNQPLVTRVAVAPMFLTNMLSHFLTVVPKSSVSSVSETREVLIATLARLSRAVVAPEPPLPLLAAVILPLLSTVILVLV